MTKWNLQTRRERFSGVSKGGTPLIGTFAEGGDSESGHKSGNKAKRVRTTFTEEQLSVLQANFQLDSNPDGQDLERIAHVTGLSKRVTQVWFQNSRARQKKHLHTGKMKGQHGTSCVCFFHRYLSDLQLSSETTFLFYFLCYSVRFFITSTFLFYIYFNTIWSRGIQDSEYFGGINVRNFWVINFGKGRSYMSNVSFRLIHVNIFEIFFV